MDTDKKLKSLIEGMRVHENQLGDIKLMIERTAEVTEQYDGFHSGNDDEEFFEGVCIGCEENIQDIGTATNNSKEVAQQVLGLYKQIESRKSSSRDKQLGSEEIDEINEQMMRLESRYLRNKKYVEDVREKVHGTIGRLVHTDQHSVEGKLKRRQQELSELDKYIDNIYKENAEIRDRLQQILE